VDFDISLSFFVIRNFSGACSSVEMLKGYMVRERLGTSDLDDTRTQTLFSSKVTPKLGVVMAKQDS